MGYSLGKLRKSIAGSGTATQEAKLGDIHPDASNCKMSNYILEDCGVQNGVAETTNIKYYRNSGQSSATSWGDLNAAGALVDAHWVCAGFACSSFLGWSYYTYTVSVEDNLSWKNYKASCAAQLMERESNWTSWVYCSSGALCGYSPIGDIASSANDTDDAGNWNHYVTSDNGKVRIGKWSGNAGGSVNITHTFKYKYHDGFNIDSTNYDSWRGTVQFNTSNA